jgi:hypothetical protein
LRPAPRVATAARRSMKHEAYPLSSRSFGASPDRVRRAPRRFRKLGRTLRRATEGGEVSAKHHSKLTLRCTKASP